MSKLSCPPITSGSTFIELEHAIGLNTACSNPVYYQGISVEQNENDNNNNFEQKENANKNESGYLRVCGSSIVLSSFTDSHNQSFLRGHTDNIQCCTISPNRKLIASSQRGNTPDICIWVDGKLIYKLEEHNGTVTKLSFSLDSRFLASIGSDQKMFIWDMSTGYIVTSSAVKPIDCTDIIWGGRVKDIKKRLTTDYLFATCGNEEVRIWAMTPSTGHVLSEKCNTSTLHLRRKFTCLKFSPSADLLIAGTSSGDFFLFDVRRLTALTSYPSNCIGGISSIISTKMSDNIYIHDPLNSHFFINIIVGCGDGSISSWTYNDDLQNFIESNRFKIPHDGGIKCMDMNSNHSKLLVATTKGSIHEIDMDNILCSNNQQQNKQKTKIISYNVTSPIVGVQFSSNCSNEFVSVCNNGSIRKWDINNHSIILSHDAYCSDNNRILCFDCNDEVILTGWNDGAIRSYNSNQSNDGMLWDIRDAHNNGGITALTLGYNEKYIISAGYDGSLRIWDVRFKKLMTNLKEHTAKINTIQVYSDSRHVITCSQDRSLICWDLASSKRISCHRQNIGSMNDVKLTKDEKLAITVGSDRCITFWDLRQLKPINYIKNAHQNDINCIQISNNGKSILTSSINDSILKLWDLNNYRLISKQNAYSGKINDLAFTHDDKQIISVADDSSIMLWNIFEM